MEEDGFLDFNPVYRYNVVGDDMEDKLKQEEIQKQKEEAKALKEAEKKKKEEERERNKKIIEVFTEMALVVSVIPVFIYHNKIAKKARNEDKEEVKN